MVSLVFLNLFIAIILEGFAESTTDSKIRVNEDCLNSFIQHWCKYDPQGKGLIDVNQLENLIMDLIIEEMDIMKK